MMGSVTNGPPSFGQQVITGSFVISGLLHYFLAFAFSAFYFGIQLANWPVSEAVLVYP
jgi:hypothetical protein